MRVCRGNVCVSCKISCAQIPSLAGFFWVVPRGASGRRSQIVLDEPSVPRRLYLNKHDWDEHCELANKLTQQLNNCHKYAPKLF